MFGKGKKDAGEAQETEDFAAASDAEWARPADAGAIGADEPPPAGAAPVADVPPPQETAVSETEPGSTSIAASLPVGSELAQQRPEVLVGAAFAGAFVFARILKHITSE
jgi:hypothetical protein